VKTRVLAHEQQVVRIDREQATPLPTEQRRVLLDQALAWLENASALVIQDYDKGTLSGETARQLLSEAARRNIPSIVDPKLRHFFEFSGASVLKPNLRELAAALGVEHPRLDSAGLRDVVERADCSHLVVTLGADGMLLYSRDSDDVERLPARRREVYDVSGAGDTVTAVLGAGLGTGAPLRRVAALANFAAGLVVTRQGTRPVSAREIREALPETRS
jgi:D-beta-D-heptose 7-phosphate kinase/D-beta-D-heptose 1-phosphate adenosyltransferase